MIPLADRNPTARIAFVTVLLIVVDVGVYLFLQQGRSGVDEIVAEDGRPVAIEADLRFNLESAAIPCEIVQGEPLTISEIEATFLRGDDTACDDDPDAALFPGKRVWVAMVVSMFLHGDLLHLGMNMLFLWVFGNNIEDRLGHARYLGFYLLGGVVATVGHVLVQPSSTVPVVGASGAIAAVMGAYLVWFPAAPVRTLIVFFLVLLRDLPAGLLLGAWFVLQFFTAPDAGVAWVAHVAGFVFGVVVAAVVRSSDHARMAVWRGQYGRGPSPWQPGPPDWRRRS